MQVIPLSPSMGAIITGVNLSNGIEPEQAAEIRALWLDYQIIVIRGQKLTPPIQLEIARAFGEPDHYPFLKGLEGYPEITPVLKREDEARNFGGLWHTDTIYQPSPPMATKLPAATGLRTTEKAATTGGECDPSIDASWRADG